MKIRISQSGGFAGVPIELADVDTGTLQAPQAERLERLVGEVAFFRLPAHISAGAETIGADNDLRYAITVEQEGKKHTVTFADNGGGLIASASGGLRALVASLMEGGPF